MKVNWGNVWILLRTDLKMSLRSKGLFFFLGIPLVLSVVMGFATRQPSIDSSTLVILGETKSPFVDFLSQARMGEAPTFKIVDMERDEAKVALERGKVDGVLELQEGTASRLSMGQDVPMKLMVDESSRTTAAMLPNLLRELGRIYAGAKDPVQIEVEGIRGITMAQSMLPMWVIMAVLAGISLLPAVLASERQTKTLDALLVTPVSFLDVIIGRSAYGVVIGLFGAFILLAVNGGFIGNQLLVWAYILLGSVMSVLLGLFVGLFRKDVQSASMMASLLYILFMWGIAFSEIPGPIAKFCGVMPSLFLANGMRQALFTTVTWPEQLLNLGVPLGVTALAFVGCLLALRKQEA